MRTTRPNPLLFLVTLLAASAGASAPGTVASPPGSIQFVGKNGIATANGTFHSWKIAASQIDLASLDASFVEIEVDVASLDTGNEARDEHLRTGDFFEVEKFPTAGARLHSARAAGSDDAGRAQYEVTIELRIRGTTHSVPGMFSVVSEAPLRVEGSLTINRTQWGIGDPDQWFNPVAIRDAIPITFQATLVE